VDTKPTETIMVYSAICGRLLLAIACAASCGVMNPEPCAMEYLSVPIICTVLKIRPIPPITISTTETVISNPHGKFFGVLFLFIFLQNVKEHAPLSAGASVDHGVEVEGRKWHVNRAADRGCVSRLVVPLLYAGFSVGWPANSIQSLQDVS
jgi:hypothetical protein